MPAPLSIEFHHGGGAPADAPMPVPMRDVQPGWFAAMPGAIPEAGRQPHDDTRLTVRGCAPFVEAMTFGYAMLWPMSLTLTVHSQRPDHAYNLICEPASPALLQSHPPAQTPGMPGARFPILKLLSPWIIRTPDGTSCLIAPLANRPEHPLIPFSAVVETDRYFTPVNFTFMLPVPVGGSIRIERGEPFAQIMPFRRDDWVATRGEGDADAAARTRALFEAADEGVYARHIRARRLFR